MAYIYVENTCQFLLECHKCQTEVVEIYNWLEFFVSSSDWMSCGIALVRTFQWCVDIHIEKLSVFICLVLFDCMIAPFRETTALFKLPRYVYTAVCRLNVV